MKTYPPSYWDKFYEQNLLGWDIGYVSTPLKSYFDQIENKTLKILVPGAGNGWEVEYLFNQGFLNTYMLDFSKKAIEHFTNRFPGFPHAQIINEDFFLHQDTYDLIVEQTFFSSLLRSKRKDYVAKVHELLQPDGKLVGLLFNHEFPFEEPPFGGTTEEYKQLFSTHFKFVHFATAYNSIKPRKDRELFILLKKRMIGK